MVKKHRLYNNRAFPSLPVSSVTSVTSVRNRIYRLHGNRAFPICSFTLRNPAPRRVSLAQDPELVEGRPL